MRQDVVAVIKYHTAVTMITNDDEKYMQAALKEAKKAYYEDEVPVGCVIIWNDKIIARGHNKRDEKKSIFAHAEMIALAKASKKVNSWILDECTVYITLEPCLMCSGALLQARVKRIVIGAMEPKHGACGSVIDVFQGYLFNHIPQIDKGCLSNASSELLKSFFKELRAKSQLQKKEKTNKN